ncbi:hypothetical protein HYW18_03070 [Candidatus Uhrbacteria bacterium]|nr:hypothetical protein [Candidatus Uhrbacteria bacterium]
MPWRKEGQRWKGIGPFALFFLVVLFLLGWNPLHTAWSALQRIGVSILRLGSFADETSRVESQLQSCAEDLAELRSRVPREEERALFTSETVVGGWGSVLGSVIARSLMDGRSIILVNRGEADGVQDGAAVVAGDRILIGTVEDVRAHTSVVRLVSDHRSRISSKTVTSQLAGVSEGARGSLLNLTFIPKEVPLALDDLILTAGLEGTIPADLVIGTITDMTQDDTAAFGSASIEPLLDSRLISLVRIFIPPAL